MQFNWTRALITCWLVGAVACSGDSNPDDRSKTRTFTIGTQGGTITAGDLQLQIPEGALAQDVDLAVTESSDAPSEIEAGSKLYELEPHGLTFDLPVIVSIAFSSDPGKVAIFWSDDGAVFKQVETTVEGAVAHTTTSKFSWAVAGDGDGAGPALTCELSLAETFDTAMPAATGEDDSWSITASTSSDFVFSWSDTDEHRLSGGHALAYTDGSSASFKGAVTTLTTPLLKSHGCDSVRLAFAADIQSKGLGATVSTPGMVAEVLLEVSGKLPQVTANWFDQTGAAAADLDLTPFLYGAPDFKVTFRATQQDLLELWWAIDNIQITAQ